MATERTFTDLKDGWGLVVHFTSNIITSISLGFGHKGEGYRQDVERQKTELENHLEIIATQMAVLGYIEDSAAVLQIRTMVNTSNLTDDTSVRAIHAKLAEFRQASRQRGEQ